MHYNLPVPCDQPLGGNWVGDPYGTPLPVPHKPFFVQRSDLAWVLATTAAVLVSSLQEDCRSGPVSTFAYNLFSQNMYANDYFMTIVDDASDFALQQLSVMRQGADQVAEVTRAVKFYATYAAAACVPKFPLLLNYMTPEMRMRVDQVIRQWQSISGATAPAYQTAVAGVGAHPGAVPGQGTMYGAPVTDLGQLCSGVGGLSTNTGIGQLAYNPPAPLADSSKFGADNRPRPAARVQQSAPVNDELAALGVTQVSGNVPQTQPAPTVERVVRPRPMPQTQHVAGVEVQVEQPSQLPESHDIPEVSVFGDSAMDHFDADVAGFFADEEAEEGVLVEPSPKFNDFKLIAPLGSFYGPLPTTKEQIEALEKSGVIEVLQVVSGESVGLVNDEKKSVFWSSFELADDSLAVAVGYDDPGRTWSIERPHSHPYNPLSFIRYLVHRADTGEMIEAFLPRDPVVDYLDLEFDAAKRNKARLAQLAATNILADTSMVRDIAPREVPYTIINTLEEVKALESNSDQTVLLDYTQRFVDSLTFFESSTDPVELSRAVELVEEFSGRVLSTTSVPATCGRYVRSFFVPGLKQVDTAELASETPMKRVHRLAAIVKELLLKSGRAALYIDQLFTREVNSVLMDRLGIEDLNVHSFAEDLSELSFNLEEKSDVVFGQFYAALHRALRSYNFAYEGDTLTMSHCYQVIGLPVRLDSCGLDQLGDDAYRLTSDLNPELLCLVTQQSNEMRNPKSIIFGREGILYEVIPSVWDEGYVTLRQYH